MRLDRFKINRVIGLREIKEDLRQQLREHHKLMADALEDVADSLYDMAYSRAPVETGTLRDSIIVKVSMSPRYPGLIVLAQAFNPNTGYDYAPIQEVNEEYHHKVGQAHFLEDSFREAVEQFYAEMGW